MIEEITDKKAIIFASGTFLTEHLPEEYEEWEEQDLYIHLVENVWEPFEYYSGEQIWEFIEHLAYDFKNTIKELTWAKKERLQE